MADLLLGPDKIQATFDVMNARGVDLISALVPFGHTVTLVLVGIMVTWHVYMMILDDSLNETIANIINVVVLGGVATGLIANWVKVYDLMKNGIDSIVTSAIGAGGFDNAMTKFAMAISTMMSDMPPGSEIVAFLTALIIALAAIVFIIMVNIGDILLYVTMLLGPVFLPFIIFPPASFLANGIITFIIASACYKLVGYAIAVMSMPAVESIYTMVTSESYRDNPGVPCVIAMMWSFLMLYLMAKIPSIVQGLTTGQAMGMRMRAPRIKVF